jgi:hypothetical protein
MAYPHELKRNNCLAAIMFPLKQIIAMSGLDYFLANPDVQRPGSK